MMNLITNKLINFKLKLKFIHKLVQKCIQFISFTYFYQQIMNALNTLTFIKKSLGEILSLFYLYYNK